MSIFNFKLQPLEKTDWLTCWFGLTDGHFWMDVGKDKLFHYSEEALNIFSKETENTIDLTPYREYQVVRYYEDLLSQLVDFIEPIPESVSQYISSEKNHQNWYNKFYEVYKNTDNTEIEILFGKATFWLDERRFYSLGGDPEIWIWRFRDIINIRWDTREIKYDSELMWSAGYGTYQISFNEFMKDVEHFHDRLMTEMADRISTLKANNPFPDHINVQSLANEHQERTQSLRNALARKPYTTDWSEVLAANQSLLNLIKSNST